ncbi:hypothetical protein HMPREF9554_02999 [Treponema phagedenis F0421]|nr:hypothetical protein HMPREF9554_02999 [Treponema phagedenis F0421]
MSIFFFKLSLICDNFYTDPRFLGLTGKKQPHYLFLLMMRAE